MRALLLKYWDRIRTSFWFLPSMMAVTAAAIAFGSVGLDESVTDDWLEEWGWAYSGGAEGASALLGTVAGSMITIAGVVFSLTLVALSLASSQFGPRLLRNFMRDTSNQVVLGTFISTFLYCLLVLRTIRHGEDSSFVPHLSVTFGVLLAVVSLGVLIYFIHHVSVSIQAEEIIARVGDELFSGIERLFPEQIGEKPDPEADQPPQASVPAGLEEEAYPLLAKRDGYLQFIDANSLLEKAEESDALFRIPWKPGHYVMAGSPLLYIWPKDRMEKLKDTELQMLFVLGSRRTPSQDIEFAVHELVEIAARALSPGVNDPFTAITCVDRLGSALCRLVQREMPSPYRFDEKGELRVLTTSIKFAGVADAAFNQIRQHARGSAAVSIRLLEVIEEIMGFARKSEYQATLYHHAKMIARGADEALPEEEDRKIVQSRLNDIVKKMNQPLEEKQED